MLCAVISVRSLVWSVQSDVKSLSCAMCGLQCVVHSVHAAVCSVQCVVSTVQFAVLRVQYAVHSVKCAWHSVQCASQSVQCAVWRVQCGEMRTCRFYAAHARWRLQGKFDVQAGDVSCRGLGGREVKIFSKLRFLAHTVWEWRCIEDLKEKDMWLNELISDEGVCRKGPGYIGSVKGTVTWHIFLLHYGPKLH